MNRTPRSYLVECTLGVAIFVPIVLMFCAIQIAIDLHASRLEFSANNAELRRETFRRVDKLLWKADTGLEIASAMRLDLGNLITALRSQVKQSSDASTKATSVQTKALTNLIDKTTDSLPPVTSVEVAPSRAAQAKTSDLTITVPVLLPPATSDDVSRMLEVSPVPPRRLPWYRSIWPWRRLCGRN